MSESNQIIETVRALDLPSDQYAVFGSGLMDVLGIRKSNDIDLVVTKDLFRKLSTNRNWHETRYPDGCLGLKHRSKNIELFYESKMPFCSQAEIEGKISRAVTIDGMKFVQLSGILAWKKALGREKDIEDVKIIEDYIDKQEKEETR